uniref:Uncharacterized protein n=1 Tax=Anguilla anguilla TaxID=7936 RepID=A0A0E9VDA5_ANGAN
MCISDFCDSYIASLSL